MADYKIQYIATTRSGNPNEFSVPVENANFNGYSPQYSSWLAMPTVEPVVTNTVETVEEPVVNEERQQKSQKTKPRHGVGIVKPELLEDEEPVGEGKIYTDKNEFISDMMDAYTKELSSRGIDTNYAKYLVAQDALESGWGKSKLSKHYNFGGVKASADSTKVAMKTHEYDKNNTRYEKTSDFRTFKNLADYVKYKVSLLSGDRYKAFIGDIAKFYDRVAAGGYATDPNYVSKLMNMYNSFKLGGRIPSKYDNLVKDIQKIIS
jgi:peptidoglycan hydrolase FlgJ